MKSNKPEIAYQYIGRRVKVWIFGAYHKGKVIGWDDGEYPCDKTELCPLVVDFDDMLGYHNVALCDAKLTGE